MIGIKNKIGSSLAKRQFHFQPNKNTSLNHIIPLKNDSLKQLTPSDSQIIVKCLKNKLALRNKNTTQIPLMRNTHQNKIKIVRSSKDNEYNIFLAPSRNRIDKQLIDGIHCPQESIQVRRSSLFSKIQQRNLNFLDKCRSFKIKILSNLQLYDNQNEHHFRTKSKQEARKQDKQTLQSKEISNSNHLKILGESKELFVERQHSRHYSSMNLRDAHLEKQF